MNTLFISIYRNKGVYIARLFEIFEKDFITTPTTFRGNKERDKEVNAEYKKMGWLVFRIWEHQFGKNIFNSKLDAIIKILKEN